MTRAPQLRAVLLAAALGALLGACAGPAPAPAPSGTETRDRVTASDEPEAQKRARARMELASAYYSRGQMTTALDQVKLAIAADPLYGEAFNLRGLIYSNLGEKTLGDWHPMGERLRAVFFIETSGHIGFHKSEGQSVDRDVGFGDFLGQSFGKSNHSRL